MTARIIQFAVEGAEGTDSSGLSPTATISTAESDIMAHFRTHGLNMSEYLDDCEKRGLDVKRQYPREGD